MSLDEDNKVLMAELIRKRGSVKGSLTRCRTFVDKFDSSKQSISLLEFRQEDLPQINRKFDDIQSQIEMISTEPDKEEEERDAFETTYFNIRASIQELINS